MLRFEFIGCEGGVYLDCFWFVGVKREEFV